MNSKTHNSSFKAAWYSLISHFHELHLVSHGRITFTVSLMCLQLCQRCCKLVGDASLVELFSKCSLYVCRTVSSYNGWGRLLWWSKFHTGIILSWTAWYLAVVDIAAMCDLQCCAFFLRVRVWRLWCGKVAGDFGVYVGDTVFECE